METITDVIEPTTVANEFDPHAQPIMALSFAPSRRIPSGKKLHEESRQGNQNKGNEYAPRETQEYEPVENRKQDKAVEREEHGQVKREIGIMRLPNGRKRRADSRLPTPEETNRRK